MGICSRIFMILCGVTAGCRIMTSQWMMVHGRSRRVQESQSAPGLGPAPGISTSTTCLPSQSVTSSRLVSDCSFLLSSLPP